MKRQNMVEKNTISPFLKRIWEEIWVGDPSFYPKTIDKYIYHFDFISFHFRKHVADLMLVFKKKPVCDSEIFLSSLDQDLSWLLSTTNDVLEECKRYRLGRKQRRMIGRTQKKNEEVWSRINRKFAEIQNGNEDLFWEHITDYSPEEIPYKKDFSVILESFEKFSFQKN